jgi:hypothetical protein
MAMMDSNYWRKKAAEGDTKIARLRAELAAEKERSEKWKDRHDAIRSTTDRLHKELAAEKETRQQLRKAMHDMHEMSLHHTVERCAKIADGFTRVYGPVGCRIAAAIRASNAAPPHVEPSAEFDKHMAQITAFEPSAAESERWMEVTCVDCWKVFDTRVPTSATEARMLELARNRMNEPGTHGSGYELAALVIETFGKPASDPTP